MSRHQGRARKESHRNLNPLLSALMPNSSCRQSFIVAPDIRIAVTHKLRLLFLERSHGCLFLLQTGTSLLFHPTDLDLYPLTAKIEWPREEQHVFGGQGVTTALIVLHLGLWHVIREHRSRLERSAPVTRSTRRTQMYSERRFHTTCPAKG